MATAAAAVARIKGGAFPPPLRRVAYLTSRHISSATGYSSASSRPTSSLIPSQPSQPFSSPTIKLTPPSRPYSSSKPSTNNNNNTDRMADQSEPTGCIAKEGIELFTLQTPNGYKASILLEELKEAYGDRAPKVTYQTINIGKNTQKEKWFTDICPNGRIPAIVDHDRGDFAVFEGLAILSYLTKHYDPDNKISFPYESDDHSVAEQWTSWQHGGVGPMQGQANHFLHAAKEKIPYGIQRYVGESERLYGILDARLKDRDFVAGAGKGRFSIADISLVGWANVAKFSGVDLPGLFPNVAAWVDRCLARPGVQRGFSIPVSSSISNEALTEKIKEDSEAKQKSEETKKLIDNAKTQYGYKFASP